MKNNHHSFGFWLLWGVVAILVRNVLRVLQSVVESSLWETVFRTLAGLVPSGLCIGVALVCWKKDPGGNYLETPAVRWASLIGVVVGVLGSLFLIVYPNQ